MHSGWIESPLVDDNEKSTKRIFCELHNIRKDSSIVRKVMVVDYAARKVTKMILGKVCESGILERQNLHPFFSLQQLQTVMVDYDKQQLCSGITDSRYRDIAFAPTGYLSEDGTWRSHE